MTPVFAVNQLVCRKFEEMSLPKCCVFNICRSAFAQWVKIGILTFNLTLTIYTKKGHFYFVFDQKDFVLLFFYSNVHWVSGWGCKVRFVFLLKHVGKLWP